MKFVLFLCLGLLVSFSYVNNELDSKLKEVKQLEYKKLPKSANKKLKEVEKLARAKKMPGYQILAKAKIILNDASKFSESNEKKINEFNRLISKIPKEHGHIVNAILGYWYWQYYNQNKWRILTRTKTIGLENTDFTTWDAEKLLRHSASHFEKSLKYSQKLKQTKLKDYYPLIQIGSYTGDSQDESLYEFVNRQLIKFYSESKSVLTSAQDEFEILSSEEGFSSIRTFLKFNPKTTDTESSKLRVIQLYQNLLKYYLKKKNDLLLVDTDIKRLLYVYTEGIGSQKQKIFLKRLKEIETKYTKVRTVSLAHYQRALISKKENDYVMAKEICELPVERFKGQMETAPCYNLIQEISRKEFSSTIDYMINQDNSEFQLKYRNVENMTFRIYQDDPEVYLKQKWKSIGKYINREDLQKILKTKPIKEWSIKLEKTKDHHFKSATVSLPKLKYGLYRVFTSYNGKFDRLEQNKIDYGTYWYSDATALVRNIGNELKGIVFDAHTGHPLSGAKVTFFKRNKKGFYEEFDKRKILYNGRFQISNGLFKRKSEHYLIKVDSKKGSFYWHDELGLVRSRLEKRTGEKVQFFTDRSIYRPGQIIYFKGICQKFNQEKDKYQTFTCKNNNITLHDANGQLLDTKKVSASDLGSFNGQFTAPINTLTGAMIIRSSISGQTTIRVEEYKRPKFEVIIDKLKTEYKLEQLIPIHGSAIGFSGAAINNAKVKYRVIRSVKFPIWWRWFNPFKGKSKEITNGITRSDDQGKFTFNFLALPNLKIDKSTNPSFHYEISVDVIDPTGETRSVNTSTELSYTSLVIELDMKNWLTSESKQELKIKTKSYSGEEISNTGVIKIFLLNNPKNVMRMPSKGRYFFSGFVGAFSNDNLKRDKSDFHNWEIGKEVKQFGYQTKDGETSIKFKLSSGAYRVLAISKDKYGSSVETRRDFIVFPTEPATFLGIKLQDSFPINIPSFFVVEKKVLNPGEKLLAFWGTGYEDAQAKVIISQNHKILKSYWTKKGDKAHLIKFPITKKLKGGFNIEVLFVRDNQIYQHRELIHVTRPESELKLSFKTFRSKLTPGEKETWTIQIEGIDATKFATEMVATLYDQSLDELYPHNFSKGEWEYWEERSISPFRSNLFQSNFNSYYNKLRSQSRHFNQHFSRFASDITNSFNNCFSLPYPRRNRKMFSRGKGPGFGGSQVMPLAKSMVMNESGSMDKERGSIAPLISTAKSSKSKKAKIRNNLNETAFFYPKLLSDKNGIVKIEFEMPDALTKWKFMSFAHTQKAQSGTLTESIITQKELMVTPNTPRFLRQGDILYFTAKVNNMTDRPMSGFINLELENSLDNTNVIKSFLKSKAKLPFNLKPKGSKTFSWKLNIPDVSHALVYRIIAKTEKFSDGEEGILPILSKSVLVKESIPLWISDKGSRSFKLKKLLNSNKSKTLKHQKLVVQMVSNPSWYALQALPYIEEDHCECLDGTFNRLYANLLGNYILKEKPEIEKIFKQWQGTKALSSNLKKNDNLKEVLLAETPWVLDAESEGDGKKKIANFFNENALNRGILNGLDKLKNNQLINGGWSWFPGGNRRSDYVTLHIVTGFARLRSLGVEVDMDLALNSLPFLDKWIQKLYDDIKKPKLNHLSTVVAFLLYSRSFYLKDRPIPAMHKKAYNYYLKQANKYWSELRSRLSEAHIASATYRFNRKKVTNEILKSLRERALHSEELGMYWKSSPNSYFWYHAPISIQTQMIELFSQVGAKESEIDKLKIWLLKQKQTTAWKTSTDSTNAVYSLLIEGSDWLKDRTLTQVALGKLVINSENNKTNKVKAGSGFYEKHFGAKEIIPNMGNITISKRNEGVSWGAVHWEYFEDLSKVTSHKSPLSIAKIVLVRKNDKKGPKLIRLGTAQVEVGDTLVSRLVVKVDRDMEYVHLKDMRGSGVEPLNVLSSYQFLDGLFYYVSTKDTATHYYFEILPKGTYVFEYDSRVFHRGVYQLGFANIRSFYAPEFSSHSKSFKVKVN